MFFFFELETQTFSIVKPWAVPEPLFADSFSLLQWSGLVRPRPYGFAPDCFHWDRPGLALDLESDIRGSFINCLDD